MKNYILTIGLIILTGFSIFGQNSFYEMDYCPEDKTYVVATQDSQLINGKKVVVTNTIVKKYWLEDFVNKQIKADVEVTYDQHGDENNNLDLIVLTKNNVSIAIFDYNGKSYLVTKHKLFDTKKNTQRYSFAYQQVFYGELSFSAIKQKLGAEEIMILSQENLLRVIEQL